MVVLETKPPGFAIIPGLWVAISTMDHKWCGPLFIPIVIFFPRGSRNSDQYLVDLSLWLCCCLEDAL